MRIASLSDVKAHLSDYVDQAETEGPVIITRNGRAVAVLLTPLDDDDLESLILARSPRFQALLQKSRESLATGKGLPRKDFWKAVAQRRKKGKASRTTAAG
jgi:prevent-host-death family protein